jgi:hypothetical protein
MIGRSLLPILVLFVIAAGMAHGQAFGRDYYVVATDGAFEPNILFAQPGERVHVAVEN